MKLYSETITSQELVETARSLGMNLHEHRVEGPRIRGKYKGHMVHQFTIRPQHNEFGDEVRMYRIGMNGKPRKVWAVSWQGHYDFMRALFNLDPNAVLVTSLATYDGIGGFFAEADRTGKRNIGSVMQPLAYADANSTLLDEVV